MYKQLRAVQITKKRRFLAALILLLSLVVLLFGGKLIYEKTREPAKYKTTDAIYVSPSQNSSQGEPREPGRKALLPEATWVPQTFNNCGPATVSMVLQYFGHAVGQDVTKARLRTNPDDKNVFTYEIADYLRTDFNIESRLMYGGNLQVLKKLLANGFYVVIEDWLHPNEDIGHTTIIRGFDDDLQVLIADDSFIGTNITYPYTQFVETQWKAFNYEFLPVYTLENESLVKSIVGELWDQKLMYEHALSVANEEISKNSSDMYAYFNKGTSLAGLGRASEAREAFEISKGLGWPKRMLWYQIQPIEVYNKLGEFQKALEMADLALWSNDTFAEAHFEKAIAFKGLNQVENARSEAQRALELSPNFGKAEAFLDSL